MLFAASIKKSLALSLLTVLTLAGSASAHEFILKPATPTPAKGQSFRVEAQAAHIFMVSEEAEKTQDVRLELRQGTASSAVPLSEDKAAHTLAGQATLTADGTALLVGHRLPQIWSDTTEGVLEGDRKALQAQGKKVLKVGKYEKFAKTLLNPSASDKSFQQPVGHALELVLLTNPAGLKAGDEVKVQALLRGKPVKAKVGVSYDGYSDKEDNYVAEAESNADGVAAFKLEKPGLWMARTAVLEPVTDGSADKQELRAVYVFPVR